MADIPQASAGNETPSEALLTKARTIIAEQKAQIESLSTEYSALKDATLPFFTWIYNQGYNQGHHDTVEGMYTDVLPEDSSEYHDDIVMELLAEYARDVWVASDSGSPVPVADETCAECHGTGKTVISKAIGVEDCPVCVDGRESS